MALRFNPPPNWPAPPEGFNPPAGWQPDPAWGPAPEGWQLWVEDSAPGSSAGSAPQASSAADAAWAPTQAVPAGSSPVADPTGQSASAPSGDYAGSAAGVGADSGASPYAPGMNYAQSPTPYHNQSAPGGPPPGGPGWQPADMSAPGGPGPKPVTQQWWFWLIIGVLVIALVGGILAAVLLNRGAKSDPAHSPVPAPSITGAPGPGPTSGPTTPSASDPGMSEKNPLEADSSITFKADAYSLGDPNSSVDVALGVVEWDATQKVKDQVDNPYTWKRLDPGDGSVYVRVPVSVTYHGTGQYEDYGLKIDYVENGNTTSSTSLYSVKDEFSEQDMPRDGGTAKGYITFLLTKEQAQAKNGVFAVKGFSGNQETYIKPRS